MSDRDDYTEISAEQFATWARLRQHGAPSACPNCGGPVEDAGDGGFGCDKCGGFIQY